MLDIPNIPDIPAPDAFVAGPSTRRTGTTPNQLRENGSRRSERVRAQSSTCRDRGRHQTSDRVPALTDVGGPRVDEPFTPAQQAAFARDPAEARSVRDAAFQQYEMANFDVDSPMTKQLTEVSYNHLMAKVKDPGLRANCFRATRGLQAAAAVAGLVPDIRAAERHAGDLSHHRVHRRRAAHRRRHRARGGHGDLRNRLQGRRLPGRHRRPRAPGGRRLHDDWRDGPEAYLGTAVPGYPNLFTLYGPNTNGVTSIIYILEAQTEFVQALRGRDGASSGSRRLRSSGTCTTRSTSRSSDAMQRPPCGWPTAAITIAIRAARWSPSSRTADCRSPSGFGKCRWTCRLRSGAHIFG